MWGVPPRLGSAECSCAVPQVPPMGTSSGPQPYWSLRSSAGHSFPRRAKQSGAQGDIDTGGFVQDNDWLVPDELGPVAAFNTAAHRVAVHS